MRLMLISAVLAAGLLPACTRIPISEGYVADEQLLASVQPGVDNKSSVQRTLGRPTMAAQFDGRQWYYISRNSKQLAFLRPVPSAQSILIITFDAKDVVQKVERRGLEQVASITPNPDKTPTLGRDESLLDDLFGNIGQFGGVPAGGPPQ
ncbi:outer membrane protein assembly factor BamE [Sandaracinobacteroides saxicola]|uniref:Outer membrane protein assembly factor BamE n=1 Tax=Sandaracinobacteroides saxicola TaxID=2759707 RepID=A0A7G5IF46_9SPHN|nr:outer membrane protein assembly factor BamE [Sandaracinobacteroides saxicola]QMW21988.1 outer membrane protein assembly factor BamE [Sandaracinobacteroides saxicola]